MALHNKKKKFQKCTALVTGAGRGIGRAIALRFSREGYNVILNDVSGTDIGSVAEEIKRAGGECSCFYADISSQRQVRRMFSRVEKEHGRLDVLVNNAGVFQRSPFEKLSEQLLDKTLAVNVKGMIFCSQEAVRLMKRARPRAGRSIRGVIVCIGSTSGFHPSSIGVHYAASKAAVAGIVRTLAHEIASFKIRVCGVAPGPTASVPLRRQLGSGYEKRIAASIPLGRIGDPEDAASAVWFLSSPEADYITGETLVVDGGKIMR